MMFLLETKGRLVKGFINVHVRNTCFLNKENPRFFSAILSVPLTTPCSPQTCFCLYHAVVVNVSHLTCYPEPPFRGSLSLSHNSIDDSEKATQVTESLMSDPINICILKLPDVSPRFLRFI